MALSADGSTLAIGAPYEASNATGVNRDQVNTLAPQSGAVYVFVRRNGTWAQQAYVKASNTDAYDQFGFSVALSADGSTLLVGAPKESSAFSYTEVDNSAAGAGAAYVFTRSGDTWQQQAYLKAGNADTGDRFGWSVALSSDGHTVAVGSPGEDHPANAISAAGAAHLFTRHDALWSQQAYVTASNAGVSDEFGYSLALSANGNRLAVGALGEMSRNTDPANNDFVGAGAAYVYDRSGTVWGEQAYLKASNPDANDRFGLTLALSADGQTLAVGARGESGRAVGTSGAWADQLDNSLNGAGAVYVFVSSDPSWSQQAYLKATVPDAFDGFGHALALSPDGDRLLASSREERSKATGFNGDANDNSLRSAGAVYAFARSAGSWSPWAYIKASNTGSDDQFGQAIALSADGKTVVVTASGEASKATGIDGDQLDDSAPYAGAAYVLNTLR